MKTTRRQFLGQASCAAVSALSMSIALLLAVFADQEIRGRAIYRTLLIWPYAIAPAISAVLWLFILDPRVGLLGRWLNAHGISWDYTINGGQAMLMVIVASAWNRFLDLDRTFEWSKQHEAKLKALTVEQVNAAFRKAIDPSRLTVVIAADASKAKRK